MTCLGQTQSIVVNDGSSTVGNTPIYSLYCDYGMKSQFIIPASELTSINGMPVTALTFFSSSTGTSWDETFTVELGEVSYTSFTSPFSFVTTGLSAVYEGLISLNASGELTIDFASPYTYQGGNLLVSIATPGKSGGVCPSMYFYCTPSTNAAIYGTNYYSDAGTQVPSSVSNSINYAPKTQITYIAEPTCTTEDFAETEGSIPDGWFAFAPEADQDLFVPHVTDSASGSITALGDSYIIMTGGTQNDTYCKASYLVLPKHNGITGVSFTYCHQDEDHGTLTLGYVTDTLESSCDDFVAIAELPAVSQATQHSLSEDQIETLNGANAYIAIKWHCESDESFYCAGFDDFEICAFDTPEPEPEPEPEPSDCVTEDFSGVTPTGPTTAGSLPENWVGFAPNGTSSYVPHVSTASYASLNNGNYLVFVGDTDDGTTSIAIMPKTDYDLTGLSFDYKYESASYGTLSVGYVTENTLQGCDNFVALAALPSTTSVTHYSLTPAQISEINESNAYVTFKFVQSSYSLWYTAGIDNIEVCVQTCPPSYSTETHTACDFFTWIDGITYTESNNTATFVYDGASVTGCDSIVKLDLTINKGISSSYTVVTCEPYEWHGVTYETTGVYDYESTTPEGCELYETLDLSVLESIPVDVYASACESYTWVDGDGQTYTQSGIYEYTYSTDACDTTKVLNLTVYHTETIEPEVVTACESYEWFGVEYIVSGFYTHITQLGAGCVRTEQLDLTISHNETSEPEVVEVCDSYEWYDQTYTESGIYTYDIPIEAGCVRTETLDLTIFTTGEVELEPVEVCGSYEWYGETYTESATLTHESVYEGGCVRTEFLELTIMDVVHNNIDITTCGEYVWNGQVYDESGDYTSNFVSTAGCDSVVTVHLTILESLNTEIDVESCDSYTWNTVNYGNSGDYTQIFANATGCDSVVTMHLTIKGSTSNEFAAEECSGFVWNDNTYYTDGDYTQYLVGANGCDSVVTMHLTIREAATSQFEVDTCEVYFWEGVPYQSTGLYYHTYEAANGCDSIVTMVLHIHELPTANVSGQFWVAEGVHDTTTLFVWGGASYLWSTGDTTNYIVVAPEHDSTYYVTVYNIWGCSVTESITVLNATGIGESAISMDVFPNPVTHMLNIQATEMKSLRISDMLGQVLLEQQATGDNMQIDMSQYASGAYLLYVTTKDGVAARKIVKR